MLKALKNTRLDVKVALLGASSVLITAIALVALAVWHSGQYNQLAQGEVEELINADLDHITQGVYQIVKTANEAAQSQVDYNLNVARHLLEAAGKVGLATDTVPWTATNQFTRQSEQLNLPKLLIGNTWVGQHADLAVEAPIVDPVTRLVGETATIFQRMNADGDMLRVATTVRTEENQRAIGTYIPAVNPDGSKNPVVAAILRGETYHGRAYVVNAWYLTAYEPLRDGSGNLVGMLYVGVKQKDVESRVRKAILQTRVGKTGYVYVLGGNGEARGRYIISHKGERDGENIWNSRDGDGRYVIQTIINTAAGLKPGEMATERYRWQNPGEPAPRWKIARLAYYGPWDWIIGTSVYLDELQTYRTLLAEGRLRMTRGMGIAGVIITVLVGLIGMLIAWTITRPVRQMTVVAEKIAGGNLDQKVNVESRDEIGILGHTFNAMALRLSQSIEGLKKSEEKYRGIFENAIEGLFRETPDGRLLNANPAMARILGYDSPDALISSITDVRRQLYVNPEDRQALDTIISEHRDAIGWEARLYRKDGVQIWASISARMVCDKTGQRAFIEGFVTDISDRKMAEEDLAESRNYLDEIINAIADPLFVKDRQHRWILVNNAMCAFVGQPREKLIGKSDYDFLLKEEADVFWSKDELVFSTGETNINEETLTDAEGIVHTLLTKKSLYTDKQGTAYIVAIIRDISDQKQAEAEKMRLEARLAQAQKMEAIGTLAGGIAHDFNNILQPMMGYSELLKYSLAGEGPQQRYVDGLYQSCMRAKELVNQILTFSRQSENKTVAVRIQSILKEVIKLSRSTIPSYIEIDQKIQKDCPPVVIDPTQLHQIAMNLIVNAYHAVEVSGGKITVCLKAIVLEKNDGLATSLQPGRYAVLSIADTGYGMDAATMDKIFEPYFTTKPQGKGTGLGLSVVYGIVKNLHGEIKVYSEVGQGTTITIYLPASTDATGKAVSLKTRNHPTGKERILLVDDEFLIVESSTAILTELGYRVTPYSSSVDALEGFRNHPDAFDLVITDMSMPLMTGEQMAEQMMRINPQTPIIICTGFSEQISWEKAKALGIKAFLMKPVTIAEISRKVRTVLDQSADTMAA
ncbi:hypothetical protein DSCO28_42690 [Desulfosarcina ovata subsp. sediminis]|uniref:histidine kinase n=1 Tax=Desulfosarcina ovata subsp. sediminis TaxID=885957 RepID=A0A5K7ZU09_9BACT|nr:Cache 3/Cache 2 fusion domain-containing protein [Desulfosarcina ovata]BBO83703.1 hypothetical protein DSCO28_42690 [Desulfosarcina ovata subsp. sediminis]